MEENEGQARAVNNEGTAQTESSPSEKLEENPPTGSLVPGAQNPESEEIKDEKNPNTE